MQINRYGTTGNTGKTLIGRYRRDDEQSGEKALDAAELVPPHGSYGHLLFDPRWQSKRSGIMARDQSCCVICKGVDELQVHHRQYHYVREAKGFKVPWDYPDQLLITLCKSCHQRGHSKFKVPIVII